MNCEDCEDKGYLVMQSHGSKVYSDDTLHIERCDNCDTLPDDESAEKAYIRALAEGTEELPETPLTLYGKGKK